MLDTRYEEYLKLDRVPLFLNENIKRTASVFSEQQNWHENIELQFCEKGEGRVLIDGKQYALKKGEVAVVSSNAIHYTYSDTAVVYSCVIVGTAFCEQMGIDYHALSFTPIVKSEKITKAFEKLREVYRSDAPLRVAIINRLLLEIMIELVSNYSKKVERDIKEKKEYKIVKEILSFVRENYSAKITLEQITKRTLTDKFTTCKVFKKLTGQTIFEHINAYRCVKASEYIAEGKTVSESAYLSGFESNSFFTKTFKRYMGALPSKYAKK